MTPEITELLADAHETLDEVRSAWDVSTHMQRRLLLIALALANRRVLRALRDAVHTGLPEGDEDDAGDQNNDQDSDEDSQALLALTSTALTTDRARGPLLWTPEAAASILAADTAAGLSTPTHARQVPVWQVRP